MLRPDPTPAILTPRRRFDPTPAILLQQETPAEHDNRSAECLALAGELPIRRRAAPDQCGLGRRSVRLPVPSRFWRELRFAVVADTHFARRGLRVADF